MGRKKIAEAWVGVRADIGKLRTDMKGAQREVKNSMGRIVGIVRGMFIRALAFMAVRATGQMIINLIKVAAAAEESENLYNVALGNMAYSAVTQPVPLPLRKGGTLSSTLAAHNTRVLPTSISADPSANLWTPGVMLTGLSSS